MKKILLVAVIGLLSLSIFAFGGYNNNQTNYGGRGMYQDNYGPYHNYQDYGYNNRMPMNRNNFGYSPMNQNMPMNRNGYAPMYQKPGDFNRGYENAGENALVTIELLINKYSPDLSSEFQTLKEELTKLREENQIQLRDRDFSNNGPIQSRNRINNMIQIRDLYSEIISDYQNNDQEKVKDNITKIVDLLKEEVNLLNENNK